MLPIYIKRLKKLFKKLDNLTCHSNTNSSIYLDLRNINNVSILLKNILLNTFSKHLSMVHYKVLIETKHRNFSFKLLYLRIKITKNKTYCIVRLDSI